MTVDISRPLAVAGAALVCALGFAGPAAAAVTACAAENGPGAERAPAVPPSADAEPGPSGSGSDASDLPGRPIDIRTPVGRITCTVTGPDLSGLEELMLSGRPLSTQAIRSQVVPPQLDCGGADDGPRPWVLLPGPVGTGVLPLGTGTLAPRSAPGAGGAAGTSATGDAADLPQVTAPAAPAAPPETGSGGR